MLVFAGVFEASSKEVQFEMTTTSVPRMTSARSCSQVRGPTSLRPFRRQACREHNLHKDTFVQVI
jgi:hypothetical protein